MDEELNLTQPTAHYDGNYITCYPGSNQSDDGKLNMEFNMARLVTRVTSKNFCITKPSYELTVFRNNLGVHQIQIGEGQCSINGMDLIMTQKLIIEAPTVAGDYYLAFKLWRDSSNNVLGDEVYGVTKTFKGVYATYLTEKPEPLNDPDVLYLGKFKFDGTNISDLEEDPDKYGRIWAEDILCKLDDPKHPDITRIILQDWIYKVPDWYVSKEGDVEYGEIDFLAGRNSDGTYGVHIKAIDDNKSEFIMKAPILDTTEPNKILKAFATNDGIEVQIGQSSLKSNSTNSYALELNTPNNVAVNSLNNVSIIGQQSVSLGTGSNGLAPKLLLQGNKATLSSNVNNDLLDQVVFGSNALQHIIGKTVLQYTTADSKLSLLGTNTNMVDIVPNVDMEKNARVRTALYLGNASTYGNETTYLKPTEWKIANSSSSTTITPNTNIIVNNTEDGAYLQVRNSNNTTRSTLYNSGKLELYNAGKNTQILFKDGASGYDVSITKTYNASELNLTASQINAKGNLTATGDIRAKRVYNAVYNDVAEFMEKAYREEDIQAGDVVYFTPDGKVTKQTFNVKALAGVVSSEETYGYALGGDGLADNEKVPVALTGRVYLNVDDLDVFAGDILAIDVDGNICKSDEYNRFTLGLATAGSKDGKVFILIR